MPTPAPALALDIGGTKIAAALVSAEGEILVSHRVPTPAGTADTVGEGVLATLDRVHEEAGRPAVAGVGIGCAGPMDWREGRVSPVNIPAWRGFALRDLVADWTPGTPVRLHNDTVCLAVGEHWRGAGRGHSSMLGIVVSTGVGGGIILDNRAVSGSHGNAGHVGHIVVDPDGPHCPCGGRGCVEAVASGPALTRWAIDNGWRPDGVASARAVAEAARAGDAVAVESFRRAGRAVGVALASALATLDVEIVAVGGGVAQAGDLLFDPMGQGLAEHARLPFTHSVPVVDAALGADAGLVGAAALVHRSDRYWQHASGPE